jgi:hypothetical protein
MQRVTRPSRYNSLPSPPASPSSPGYFGGGDPGSGIAATVPGHEWFNGVQEELLAVITAGGLTPSATDRAQVLAALRTLFGGVGSLGTVGYMRGSGGLIRQWGYSGLADDGNVFVTFPIAFPSAAIGASATADHSGSAVTGANAIGAYLSGITTAGMYVGRSMYLGDSTTGCWWEAWGY